MNHMSRRGFTIVELIITISIMAILLTLGTMSLSSSQASARDSERKTDISAIALHLETFYTSGTNSSTILTDCTGGSITHDGIYTVHKFISSGTITCDGSVDSDVLVVAGGGGGGRDGGGGGGGGGLVYNTGLQVSTGSYNVVVGNGGSSQNNGGDSSFSTIVATGGGAGGTNINVGLAGGSGGGAGYGNGLSGGAATLNQGYAGGSGTGVAYRAAGGGGAGQAGFNANSLGNEGRGGVGVTNSVSGSSIYYGGGGGGGACVQTSGIGGTGGGGNGSTSTGNNGIVNTGGGGGGGGCSQAVGGSGGLGVVVIRYLTPIIGAYPSTLITATSLTMTKALRDIDIKSLSAPGITDPTLSFDPATNNVQTTTGVTPQPTIDQYVYQPLKQDGTLCILATDQCQKFNLYYRLETDNTVYMVTSKNQ